MSCACGQYHTITLSDDRTAYSFGGNEEGALGLGHNFDISLPTPIPNLPKISQVSCGSCFAVCVDYEGFIYSFGENGNGQLGIGNTTHFDMECSSKTSQHSSCSFCFLWRVSHFGNHK